MNDYYIRTCKERLEVLDKRYEILKNAGTDEFGKELSFRTCGEYRHHNRKQAAAVRLIWELFAQVPREIELSEESAKGFELLVTPKERWTQLKQLGLVK